MATERTQGRKYPRRQKWIERRDAVFQRAGATCEISGEPLGYNATDWKPHPAKPMQMIAFTKWVWTRAADHLFPERFVRRFCKGMDPHILENLYVITPKLHAQKTAVEHRVYRGDLLGYTQELIRLGWTQAQVDRALKALWESIPCPRATTQP